MAANDEKDYYGALDMKKFAAALQPARKSNRICVLTL